ncbi:MAG: hypothetical protein ABMA13_22170 [Chthoniobacteraceae bacterium]
MIQYHLLLARKHGAAKAEALLVSFEDRAPIQLAYDEVTGPRVAAFAADFAEVLYVSDGTVLAHHEFPDPATVEAARQRKALAEARELQAAHDKAKAAMDAASRDAKTALDGLKKLTAEQKHLLAADAKAQTEREAAAAKAQTEREATAAKAREEAEAASAKAKADAEEAARVAADEAAKLSAATSLPPVLTDDELLELAVSLKIDVPASATRPQIEALVAQAQAAP